MHIPAHVPASKSDQWSAVWDNVYKSALDDGDKSREEAEARAYSAANAILSKRSATFKTDDFVIYANEDGVRQRGRVKTFIESDPDEDEEGKAMSVENTSPLVEVELYKTVRDGWESKGQVVKIDASQCTKIENLPAPSRVPRKQTGATEMDAVSIKAIIEAATQQALDNIKAGHTIPAELQIKRLGENRIGGYAVVFGDDNTRDIEGDYFVKSTDFWLDTYKNQPLFFDHAVGIKVPGDETEGDDNADPRHYKLGHITKVAPDDVGVWIEGVLDQHNDWVRGVWELVDKGALNFSSGSVPHLIKRTEDGEVKSWPIIEVSLTPTPAEPRKTLVRNVNNLHQAKGEPIGASYRSTDFAQVANMAGAFKSTNKQGVRKIMKNLKRLSGLLDAFWGEELEDAVYSFKAAKKEVKDANDIDEVKGAAEAVATASSALDGMIHPIAEQAQKALGLEPDIVKGTLLKMALSRVKADFPDEEEVEPAEDVVAEEAMPALEEEEDDAMMSSDFLRFGDEMPEDEYLDAEEDVPGMEEEKSVPKRKQAAQTRSTDIEAAVEKAFKKLAAPKGSYAVKKNINVIVNATPKSMQQFIKAIKHRTSYAEAVQKKSYAAFKAMAINPDTAGGYLVPPEQSDQVIELLRNSSLFLGGDGESADGGSLITEMPLNTDTLLIPRETGAPTAYWLGENATIPASDASYGQIQLIAKKLAARVVISNELLEDSSHDVDKYLRESIAKSLRLKVDDAILYGEGVASEPRGVYNSALTYKTALNAVPTYDNLRDLPMQLELNNVEQDDSWRWILNPRDKYAFRSLQDGNGAYIFAANALTSATLGIPPELFGYTWLASNTVARTADPNGETDVFFGKWKDVILGMRKTIEIVASDVAGTSFETDQTWIRAILRCDVALRHPESVAVLTDVREVVSA